MYSQASAPDGLTNISFRKMLQAYTEYKVRGIKEGAR